MDTGSGGFTESVADMSINTCREISIRLDSVIWDFNGTILDDVALAAASISKVLRGRNLPDLDVSTHRRVFGFPISEYYERIGFDLSVDVLAGVSDEFHEVYLAGVGACSLNDGVLELLEFFQRSNVAQFILSAAEQTMLESWVRIHQLEPFFKAVYGLPDRLGKTKTDRGIDLLSHHAIDSSQTLFIGDTDHDAEVAEALGSQSVVVLQGHQDRARFEGHTCDVFGDFGDLMCSLFEIDGVCFRQVTG